MNPTFLLINPWIHDFAAYDLWSKPLGLLCLSGTLRRLGFHIQLIDCLDVHHPMMQARYPNGSPRRRRYGTGKFWRQPISPPPALGGVPRAYSRYGITPDIFVEQLTRAGPPDAILVTSLMTYWYPGVQEVIRLAKKVYPAVPVILGGIYARLCGHHARRHLEADAVVDASDPHALLDVLGACGIRPPGSDGGSRFHPYPAFDLLTRRDYVCIMTSTGCPYGCKYCASRFLNPVFQQRDPEDVLEEILYWHRVFRVRDFAFYDDALLVDPDRHIMPLLEALVRLDLKVRFHTPNAMHVKEITREMAVLMRRCGFKTVRLGLETWDASPRRELDRKISEGDYERAVTALSKAGYGPHEIGTYILMGLPGQAVDSVMKTIDFVARWGAVPYLSEYSPIPHTALWEAAVRSSPFDLVKEPLFHNNTLLPCWDPLKKEKVPLLKKRVQAVRRKYRPS